MDISKAQESLVGKLNCTYSSLAPCCMDLANISVNYKAIVYIDITTHQNYNPDTSKQKIRNSFQ